MNSWWFCFAYSRLPKYTDIVHIADTFCARRPKKAAKNIAWSAIRRIVTDRSDIETMRKTHCGWPVAECLLGKQRLDTLSLSPGFRVTGGSWEQELSLSLRRDAMVGMIVVLRKVWSGLGSTCAQNVPDVLGVRGRDRELKQGNRILSSTFVLSLASRLSRIDIIEMFHLKTKISV